MSIYISSDFHFSHTNICGPALSSWDKGYRNFDSLESMNDTIINNLNEKVGDDDVLYFLGDFAFGDKTAIPSLRNRINCKTIHLIYGNHDEMIRKTPEYQALFTSVGDYLEVRYKKTLFCMMHYPLGSWNQIGKGAINLFGHCHGNYSPRGRQMDVGVDPNGFKPILLDDILDRMDNVDIISVDHHDKTTR